MEYVTDKLRRQRDQVKSNEMVIEFLPNSFILFPLSSMYMVQLSLGNKKLCFLPDLLIFQKQKLNFSMTKPFKNGLNHVDMNQKLLFLIKSGYYIVPSPSTALTPNTPLINTSFMNSKWNMDEMFGLKFHLPYTYTPQRFFLKFLHAQTRSFLLMNL